VKRQKTDEAMDVAAVECWCRDLLEELSRSPPVPEEEIHEARAEIIDMITAKLWSSDSRECFKTLEGHCGDFCGDRPDISSIVEVFGVDVSRGFLPEFIDGRSAFSVVADSKPRWCDIAEDDGDWDEYIRGILPQYALDDVHGGVLDLEKVREARAEEVDFMQSRGIWREVPIEEAWSSTGRGPVSVKWVDTEKLGGVVRSRLVARDFKTKGEKEREDLFAATPPLELLKAQLSRAASKRGRKVLVIDVKKAHLYPKCEVDTYIELPAEAGAKPGMCGKFVHWLYGFRPAARAWESHYSEKLASIGFARGRASPVAFYNADLDVSCLVHGDDFTFVGESEKLDVVEAKMKERFELKVKARLGEGPKDDKETDILGRVVRCTKEGFEYEADPRHREKILEAFGLEDGSKGLTVNGRLEDLDEEPVPLEPSECTQFRALAARANYLAQDAPELQFAAKEVCRDMARPSVGSWKKLKVLARFVLERVSVRWQFRWQEEVECVLRVFSDSDWAGCRRTRRSTSGGLIMVGAHCVKAWSSTQAPIALSSAEAEYYAMVEAATRGAGLRSMLGELGIAVLGCTELMSDSSAARCFAARRGVGRMRHLEVRHLWLQEEVSNHRVLLRRVAGEANPADLMTKYLNVRQVLKCLEFMGLRWISRNRITDPAEGGCRDKASFQSCL
jgi:hypothetical protein